MQLENKIALITGAGSGIGKAAALCFAKNGAKVGVLSHTEEEIVATAQAIEKAGGAAIPLIADVSDAHQMSAAVERLVARWGGLDIVFANAGINGIYAPVEELEPDEWDRTINVNLRGTFLTVKYTVPHLKKRGAGVILFTSSINGTRVFSNFGASAYSTTKGAQLAFGQSLALELAQFNIRVNVICPGSVDTEIKDNTDKRNIEKIALKAEFDVDVPLTGKPARSEQVAELALFLASDAASHITGTPIWFDGAQSLLRG